jgi:CheY-like chemotaxis protein
MCSAELTYVSSNSRHESIFCIVNKDVNALSHATSQSILVVEDDRGIRSLLELILRRDDRSILLARNGVEALRLAKRHDIDLALVDIHMPGLDGASFCRAYRERGGEAPVVMLSAAFDGPDTARACSADGFIAKPFQISTLLETVAHHLGGA